MKNSQHISQARAFANERFSGIDGFDNMSDSYQFSDDLNATGVNMHQYNS